DAAADRLRLLPRFVPLLDRVLDELLLYTEAGVGIELRLLAVLRLAVGDAEAVAGPFVLVLVARLLHGGGDAVGGLGEQAAGGRDETREHDEERPTQCRAHRPPP